MYACIVKICIVNLYSIPYINATLEFVDMNVFTALGRNRLYVYIFEREREELMGVMMEIELEEGEEVGRLKEKP